MYFNNESIYGSEYFAQEETNQVLSATSDFSSLIDTWAGNPIANVPLPSSIAAERNMPSQSPEVDESIMLNVVSELIEQNNSVGATLFDDFWEEKIEATQSATQRKELTQTVIQRKEADADILMASIPNPYMPISFALALLPPSPSSLAHQPSLPEQTKRPRSPENQDSEAPSQKRRRTSPREEYIKHVECPPMPLPENCQPFFTAMKNKGLVASVVEKINSNGTPTKKITRNNRNEFQMAPGKMFMCETGDAKKKSHPHFAECNPKDFKDKYEIVGGLAADGTEIVRICAYDQQKNSDYTMFYLQYVHDTLKVQDQDYYLFQVRNKQNNNIECEGYLQIFRHSKSTYA